MNPNVESGSTMQINLTVNGSQWSGGVDPRTTLADLLRDEIGLTGTHLSCEHGVCGSCTILIDGASARSCLTLAVQADGREVQTIEGLAGKDGSLHPVQQGFRERHSFQCGYCTPGFAMAAVELLTENPDPTEAQIREALSGNICRCSGYQSIVDGVLRAAELT